MDYSKDIDKLRHSCAHVMAHAVKELWPDVKVTIGPAIDEGFYYDFEKKDPFTDHDLAEIEKRMQKIINRNLPITQKIVSKKEAKDLFRQLKEDYKIELIDAIADEKVSLFITGDNEFIDLCKGPHVKSTGEIKAFKLLTVAGSYWHGDEDKAQLQRIYGTCFFAKEELKKHMEMLEEAKKRDHRLLGPQLELFNFYHEQAGAGLVFYHPAGATVRKIIENYIYDQNIKRGYLPVVTPHMLNAKLWVQSGHSSYYKENMYYLKADEEEYAVKPMNCPGHILIYKSKLRSYREMPLRFFELGTVYRKEKAGVLHGLLRVRGFTQDDGHIFCREDQIKTEVKNAIDFVFDVMKDFGFENFNIELSTQPEGSIGTQANWDLATRSLEESLKEKKLKYEIHEGEGAFYGPKIDIKLRDALNRQWQCATIQCDFSIPDRFQLTYANEEGGESQPIMIHRAIFGSIERFFGTIIEHYAGAFPVWLAPVQIEIIPLRENHYEYANKLKDDLQKQGLRVIIDNRNESLNKRIREGTIKKIPYLLVLGDKEIENDELAVRKYKQGDMGSLKTEDFIRQVKEDISLKKL